MSKTAKANQATGKIAEASFGAEDEALGQGLPAHWTLEALEKRVQALLDSYLSSAKSADAIKSFKDFAAETPGFFDEVVVCALRTALGCKEKQRKMVTDLLGLLYKEQVLDRSSLVRGYATLICTWQALASTKGGESSVYLAEMLLTCIRSGYIAEEFLTRLPEGFLTAVLRDERAKDTKELEKARDRLHHFKQGIEDKKLLETPLPHIDQAFSVMKEQAMPDCRHEFVKRGLAASLDWPPALRRRCLVLMGQLLEKGILTKEDFQWGVLNLLGQLEDLTLDCPDVAKIAAEHLRGLLAKDLLTTNFVLRCRMLHIGGEAGLKVLGDALEPASAAPVNLSKVAKAIEASRQDADAPGEEPKESPEDSKEKEEPKDGKDDDSDTKEVKQNGISKDDSKEDPKAHGPGANGVTAKAGGRLSGGISLRPGGGMRPGGSLSGGIGLSGGINGLSLRPGGGGVNLSAPVRESTGSGGTTASGYPQEAKKPPAPAAPKDDWRQDAAEHQNAKQKSQKDGGKGGKGKGDGGRRSGRGGRRDDEDDEIEEQLKVSENSWAAQQAKRQEKIRTATEVTTGEEEQDKEIARRMKSILNKLTLEKFDDLTRQLCECGISKEAHLKILMTEVFEKATTQHHFVEMYTSLCVHFNDWCSEHLKVGKFKPVLLQQCQESFEANLKDPPKEMSPKKKASASREELEEYEEKRQRYRLRVMGNIRFIGQLLVKRMLASKFLIPCAQELLSEATPGSNSSLEALASLLTITGGEFDKMDFKYYKQLCDVFKKVEKITKDKTVESRIRFLLQDVLDLRSSGWEDNKVATKKLEAPRKLGEFEGRSN